MEKEIRILVAPASSEVATKGLTTSAVNAVIERIGLGKLKSNLAELAQDISEMLPELPLSDGMRLKQVTVGVEISAQGGVTLIGSLSVGAKAAMTLTFELE